MPGMRVMGQHLDSNGMVAVEMSEDSFKPTDFQVMFANETDDGRGRPMGRLRA